MSIATAITDLSSRIQDAYDACEAKGATMPATKNTYNLSATIDSIQSGGGGGDTFFAATYPRRASGAFEMLMDFIIDGQTYNISEPEYSSTNTYILVQNPTSVTLNINDPWYAEYPDTFALIGYSDGTTQRITFENNPTQAVPLNGRSAVLLDGNVPCLLAGTMVMLADGTEKAIEDIDYNDNLMVWDFENGCVASAKPLWIKKAQTVDYMYEIKFASGSSINVTGPKGHRAFNIDESKFVYLNDSVGQHVKTIDGEDEVVRCEKKTGDFKYFNIITDKHLNIFANGILTSCRLNNYRAIDASKMMFVEPPKTCYKREDFVSIPDNWIDGLHLCEQSIELEELRKYAKNLINKDSKYGRQQNF